MKTKIKKSFATYFDNETNEEITDIDELAEFLSKGLGNIPHYLTYRNTIEINLLAKAFLELNELYIRDCIK